MHIHRYTEFNLYVVNFERSLSWNSFYGQWQAQSSMAGIYKPGALGPNIAYNLFL